MRLAPLSFLLALHTSGQPPCRTTPPLLGLASGKPLARASAHSAASRPGRLTRKISRLLLEIIAFPYSEGSRPSIPFRRRGLHIHGMFGRLRCHGPSGEGLGRRLFPWDRRLCSPRQMTRFETCKREIGGEFLWWNGAIPARINSLTGFQPAGSRNAIQWFWTGAPPFPARFSHTAVPARQPTERVRVETTWFIGPMEAPLCVLSGECSRHA